MVMMMMLMMMITALIVLLMMIATMILLIMMVAIVGRPHQEMVATTRFGGFIAVVVEQEGGGVKGSRHGVTLEGIGWRRRRRIRVEDMEGTLRRRRRGRIIEEIRNVGPVDKYSSPILVIAVRIYRGRLLRRERQRS